MKKIITSLVLLVSLSFFGQNTFPASGDVTIKNSSSKLIIEGSSSGNYAGGSLYLNSSSINSNHKHVSTLFINHRGTDGIATTEFQRRGKNNEYNGTILLYKDGHGWFFNAANTVTSGVSRIMDIRSNGNVGIGSTNPDEKLTVKGKIHAEEVRVDLNVPADYVFQKYYTGASLLKETYKMPTLEEVAAFTKKNHHLPEIPSAAQIQKEGLHLKQMSNLLLQKIEELTIYTIEQEKRINALESKLVGKKS